MDSINEKVVQATRQLDIRLRPNASVGIWLCPLVPVAVIWSALQHQHELTQTYRLAAVLCVGLLLSPFVFIVQSIRSKNNTMAFHLISASVAVQYHLQFHKGLPFSVLSGFASGIVYHKLFLFVLKSCPLCFTVGEATVVAQSAILLVFTGCVNVYSATVRTPHKVMQVGTLIVQMGVLAVALICFLAYKTTIYRKTVCFCVMSAFVLVFILLLPLHALLKKNPLLWMYELMFKDVESVQMTIYWGVCLILAILAVNKQIYNAKKASTVIRKTFHLLAIAAYLPGLLYKCSLLYVASAVVFGIFLFVEAIRLLNIPPLGRPLQDMFAVFGDEKDAGLLALTPIYLLVGCSLPLWLHPAPCDLTDSAGYYLLPLLSGILSVGVGDMAASIIGSTYGRHKWPGTKKTIEGTLACIASQVVVVLVLFFFGLLKRGHTQIIRSGIAIIVTSLVEAKTTQVDNLVLPLLMYLIFI